MPQNQNVEVKAPVDDSAVFSCQMCGQCCRGQGGIVVSPKDLARAIDYWLDHPNEREYMGELYRVAAKKYSLANSVRMFEEMLNEEIEDNAKQSVQA